MHMFLLQCPKCGNRMKYHTGSIIPSKKRKECVYCGKSYIIKDHIVEKIG